MVRLSGVAQHSFSLVLPYLCLISIPSSDKMVVKVESESDLDSLSDLASGTEGSSFSVEELPKKRKKKAKQSGGPSRRGGVRGKKRNRVHSSCQNCEFSSSVSLTFPPIPFYLGRLGRTV